MPPDPVPLPPPPPGFDPPRQKTTLDVWMQVAQTVGGIATPIILAGLTLWGTVFGGLSQRQVTLETEQEKSRSSFALKQEETRAHILDAAIAILKSPPDKDKPDLDRVAREWAVKVINGYKAVDDATPDFFPSPRIIAVGNTTPQSQTK
jgi:hypothetical protein